MQDGNALIDNSGSCLREIDDGEFITLIVDETGYALTVRNAIIAPDTPILAFPTNGKDNQRWKYWTPEPFVRINCIKFSFLELTFCVKDIKIKSIKLTYQSICELNHRNTTYNNSISYFFGEVQFSQNLDVQIFTRLIFTESRCIQIYTG